MATGRRAVRLLVEGVPEEELCVQGPGWKRPRATPRPREGELDEPTYRQNI